jgi:hypothetical protein
MTTTLTPTHTIHPTLLYNYLNDLYADIEMTIDQLIYTPETFQDPTTFTTRYLEAIKRDLDTIYHNALTE